MYMIMTWLIHQADADADADDDDNNNNNNKIITGGIVGGIDNEANSYIPSGEHYKTKFRISVCFIPV